MTDSTKGPEDLEQTILHQDGFRKVMLGELADPLFPPHPGEPESSEDELTRAAVEDPEALNVQRVHPAPTFWRFVALLVCAVVALAVVFRWLR